MHSSWTYHGPPLCPIHLCSPRKVSIARDGFHLSRKSSVVATLITKVLFKQNLAGNEASSFRVSGARCAIVSMQYAWFKAVLLYCRVYCIFQ